MAHSESTISGGPSPTSDTASAGTTTTFCNVILHALRLVTTAALFLASGTVRAELPFNLGDRPSLTASVESLMLWRDGLPDRPLYFDVANPSIVPLNTDMLSPGMAAGPRFRIDLSPAGDQSWEVNYFNVRSFTSSLGVASPKGELEQDDILGFLFPDVTSAEAFSSSAIQSFELNRRTPMEIFDGEFLYGFRWVEWNDRLLINDTTVTGTLTGTDLFLTNTYDSLYGGQIGVDMKLFGDRERAWIEGLGKAGIYYNNASQSSFVDSVSIDQIRRGNSASADLASFFGEVGVTGCVRFSKHWTARLGFTMFWLGNGTSASQQLTVNNLFSDEIESGISNGDSVFLYGTNVGLQADW